MKKKETSSDISQHKGSTWHLNPYFKVPLEFCSEQWIRRNTLWTNVIERENITNTADKYNWLCLSRQRCFVLPVWRGSHQQGAMSKAKLSLHSWDRLAPWSCGIVGKYLQPSHGNKTAPCQVSDLGVSDMDLNSQEGQCSHRKGLSPVSFTPLSLSVAVKKKTHTHKHSHCLWSHSMSL